MKVKVGVLCFLSLSTLTKFIILEISKQSLPVLLEDDEESLREGVTTERIREIKKEIQGREGEESGSGSGNATAPEALNIAAVKTLQDSIEHSSDSYGVSEVKKKVSLKEDSEGGSYHCVWKPKKQPHLSNLEMSIKDLQKQQSEKSIHTKPPLEPSESKISLMLRQQQLLDRVQATQAILKETTDEILKSPGKKKHHISFREASKLIISEQKKEKEPQGSHISLSDVVTQYLTKMRTERGTYAASSPGPQTPISPLYPAYKRHNIQSVKGAIPLDEWHKLVGESRASLDDDNGRFSTYV